MSKDIEYRIAKLSPKAGDVIVIRIDSILSATQRQKMHDAWTPYFEEIGCKVVILEQGAELSLVEAPQNEA